MGKPNRLTDGEYIQINQAIFILRNVYESMMRRESSDGDTSPTIAEMGVLMVLGQAGEINARSLSKMMDITPGTISQYLSSLVKRGLVEQRRDEKDSTDIVSSLNHEEQRAFHDLLVKLSHANGYEWQ